MKHLPGMLISKASTRTCYIRRGLSWVILSQWASSGHQLQISLKSKVGPNRSLHRKHQLNTNNAGNSSNKYEQGVKKAARNANGKQNSENSCCSCVHTHIHTSLQGEQEEQFCSIRRRWDATKQQQFRCGEDRRRSSSSSNGSAAKFAVYTATATVRRTGAGGGAAVTATVMFSSSSSSDALFPLSAQVICAAQSLFFSLSQWANKNERCFAWARSLFSLSLSPIYFRQPY